MEAMPTVSQSFEHLFQRDKEQRILEFLHFQYGVEVFTPGLARTRPLYQSFVELFKKRGTRIITIAGTNGKGQTAHTLGSLLSKANKNFALWTSPHILSITERFTFGFGPCLAQLTYDELEVAINYAHFCLKKDHPGLKISFYEFLFYVFLQRASEFENLEYLVLEVGLGGRLDAVNHFDADCSCITSISRDHQSILGDTYRQILAEKIAVSRSGKPLFTQFHLNYLNTLTCEYTEANLVKWVRLEGGFSRDYFRENQFMAWSIFKFFEPQIAGEFSDMIKDVPRFKGRREIMTFGAKSLIFIGAHNVDGIRRMLEEEGLLFNNQIQSVISSFSKRPTHEVEIMLKSMMGFFGKEVPINVTWFDHPKALGQGDIRTAVIRVNKGMLNFVADWKTQLQETKAHTILICGSYYFIGEVQRFVLDHSSACPST